MKYLLRHLTPVHRSIKTIVLTPLALLLATGCSVFGIESVEEAKYTVVQKDGQFEVRDYATMVVVETRVDADFREAGNNAFRKLFGYISGNNDGGEKIAMTAPVVAEQNTEATGEKIAMTAPVTASKEGETWKYRFVLPQSFDIETAPKPTDPDVNLAEVPGKRVATIRFSGRSTENAREKNTQALESWLQAQGLTATSEPRWAGYNAPWALPPFRRNEVLVDIAE